jgi:hypothetical protein
MEYFITIASTIIAYVLLIRKDRKPCDNAETHFKYKEQLRHKRAMKDFT